MEVHEISEISINEIMESVLQTLRRAGVKALGNYSVEATKVITRAIKKQSKETDLKRRLMAIPRSDLIILDRKRFEKAIEVLAKTHSDPSLVIVETFKPPTTIQVREEISKRGDKTHQPISELDTTRESTQESGGE